MNNKLIQKIEKKIQYLLRKQGDLPLAILAYDCCSEISRLVASWIKKEKASSQVLILKGEGIKKTDRKHDIIAIIEKGKVFIIDPTIWQIFPNENISVGLYDNLEKALRGVTKKYGGFWKVSEEIKNVSRRDQIEWKKIILDIVQENIKIEMNKKNLFNWQNKTSEHYIFSFSPNSVAEKEIENIIQEQEKWYSLIIKELKIKNNRKIHYYLYPSRTLKEKLTDNAGNAHTQWDDFSVHTIYSKNLKVIGPHEDTHLLTLKWGISIGLLREGLAEYLELSWHGKKHSYWAKKYIKEKKFIFEKLFDNHYFYNLDIISYPVAGSFAKFLIQKYGLEKFKKAYGSLDKEKSSKENIKNFENVYQKPIQEIELDWIK